MVWQVQRLAWQQTSDSLHARFQVFFFTSVCVCLCRELLRLGSEVVLVGNTLPAINDVTADELVSVLEDVAQLCPTIQVTAPVFA